MATFWLTVYVLVWTVIVAGDLLKIVLAFCSDLFQSRKEGRSII